MKKVLSICFLSMLLLMAAFTAKAQTATDCCFWLESMNPDTLHDVSNIGVDASGAAHLPGSGVDMLVANKLKPVESVNLVPVNIASTVQWIGDKTDWYRVKFFNNCNLPGNTRVSLEWKMYYNGTLLNDAEISNYVDMFIYTKYTQMNNNDSVLLNNGRLKWLGGLVTGPGQSHQVPNGCLGGYPGAVKDDPGIAPDGFPDFDAAGMVQISNGYNLDFFNLYFFENAETRIGFRWKQAGEYSIVLTLRERVGGTEFVIWHDATQSGYIGGNQSRCGDILAKDSIVNPTEKEYTKLLCDGDGMWIGIPPAYYTVPGTYKVVFTKPGCNGEEIDSIHYITFENRVKPAIVGHDTTLCRNEAFDVNAMKSLAPPVDIDAQNFIRYEIYWKANGAAESAWTQNPMAPSTAAAATFTYNIYQVNFYGNNYDTIECAGPVDTLTITVNDIFPPELDNTNAEYGFCINGTETSQVIKAKLNNPEGNACADEIHWFDENGTETVAFSKTVDLTPYKATNTNKNVTFTAYAYATSSSTYSVGSVTVTLHFYAYPELSVQTRQDYIKCPGSTFTVNPTVTCTNISANTFSASDLTWSYQWKKNGTNYATTKSISVTAPACDVTDTYVLTATATTPMGCTNTITYTFTVKGQNPDPIVIAWGTASPTVTLNAGCDTMSMAAPYTLADVKANGAINPTQNTCGNLVSLHYSASVDNTQAPCKLIVTRSYYVVDECGNQSNTIQQVVTINNKVVPTITGTPDTLVADRDLTHKNCTANMPARARILAKFKNNFTWSTCNTTVSDDDIQFFVGNTNVVADGNEDIFSVSNHVEVYAQVTDQCGNATQKFKAFDLYDFEKFVIYPNPFTYNPSAEVCNTDTAVVVFDPDHIWAGYYPFTFDWTKIDIMNTAGYEVSASGHADTVWAVNRGPVTTQVKFALMVTDKYGCKAYDTTQVITFYAQPTVEIVEATDNNDYPHTAPVVVCPNFGNYKIVANATSNISDAALTYAWSQDAAGTTANSYINVNRNNCTKDYVAKVTVTNAKNCAATATYAIHAEDNEAPVVTLAAVTDTVPVVAGCKIAVPNYATNGKVTATDNCWSGSDIVITQNPAAGTLLTENTDVVITVSTPCGPATTKTIKVCFPRPMEVEVTANNNAICEESPVTLTANVTLGTAPYTYKWDNKNNTNVQNYTITPAASETHHTVVVTDANGCTATDDIDITIYPKFNFTLTPHPDMDCSADINTGSIDITPNTGATFALYQGTTLLGNTFTGLAAGQYKVVATVNGNNCVYENETTVGTDYTYPNITLTSTPNHYCREIEFDGTITVTDNQTVKNYTSLTYYVNGAEYTSSPIEHLMHGDYTVYAVTDLHCTSNEATTVVENGTEFTATITTTPNNYCEVTANHPGNGAITVTNPVGSQYRYSFTGNGVNVIESTNPTLGNLGNGEYNVTVFDQTTGCSYEEDVTVNEVLDQITVTPTTTADHACNPQLADGTVTLNATSTLANPNFVYKVDDGNFVNSNVFSGITSGVHGYTVKNLVSGCTSGNAFQVSHEDFTIEVTLNLTANTMCEGKYNGSVTVNATSNNPNASFVYSMDGTNYQASNTFNKLAPTGYTFYAKDVTTDCVAFEEGAVEDAPEVLNFHVTAVPNTMCDNTTNGQLTVVIDNCDRPGYVSTDFVYQLNGAAPQASNVFSGLSASSYQVTVLDTVSNCPFNKTALIEYVHYDLTFNATPTANTKCIPSLYDGKITVSNINTNMPGTPNLTYRLTGTTENGTVVDIPAQTSPVFNNLGGGNYTVIVTDVDRNCEYTKNVDVATDNIYKPIAHITVTGQNSSTDEIALHFCLNNPADLEGSATSAYPNDQFEFDWYRACGDFVLDPNLVPQYVHYLDNTPSFTLANDKIDTCIYLLSVTSTQTQCSNYTNVRIIVDPNPTAIITVDGTPWSGTDPYEICVNKPTTTVAVNTNPSPYPIASIQWTGDKTANTASFTIAANEIPAGTTNQYNVHVVDINGCSSDDTVRIKSKPIFTNTVTVNECDSVLIHGQWFRYADNASHTFTKVVTLTAANGCDSTVTYNITLRVSPSIAVTIPNDLGADHCAGYALTNTTGLGYTQTAATKHGWIIVPAPQANLFVAPTKSNYLASPHGQAFDIHSTLTYDMNGSKIYAYALNTCDTVFSDVYTLKVNDKPYLPNNKKKMQDGTICLGNTYNMSLPSSTDVVWNTAGSKTFTTQYRELPNGTWNSISGSNYQFTPDAVGQYAFRAVATNMCGSVTVDTATITVNDTVTLTVTNKNQVILLGDAIADVEITNTYSTLQVSALPAGLTLANNKITGSPTAAGFYKIAIDANGLCNPKSDTVRIEVRDTLTFEVTPPSDRILCVNTRMEPIYFTVRNGHIGNVQPALMPGLSLDVPNVTLPDRVIIGTPTELHPEGVTYTLTATSDYTDLPKPADKVLTVTIKVVGKPAISAPAPVPAIAACEGATFTKPADPTVETNGADLYPETTGWYYNGAAFDWDNTAAAMSMNGGTMMYIVENACGRDTAFYPVTVYPTPVPEIKNDDILCRGDFRPRSGTGGALVQLLNPENYASWTWYMNGSEYLWNPSMIDFWSETAGDYIFTITVTDNHGCTSTTASNVSNPTYPFSVTNAVTIRVKEDFEFTATATPNTKCGPEKNGAITMDPATADGVTYHVVSADNMYTPQYKHVTANQEDWSGYYLLVSQPTSGSKSGNTVALHGVTTSENRYGLYDDVTSYVSGNAIAYNSTTEDAEVIISKVEGAGNEGKYTIYQNGVGFFGYNGSDNSLSAALAFTAAYVNNYWWQFSISNGNLTITNAGNPSRKLQFNASAPRFACYTSNQTRCKLYKYGWSYADLSSTNLAPGDYVVIATTSNPTCEYFQEVTVGEDLDYPAISATTTENIYCDQNNYNGTLTITDHNNPNDVNYTSVTYYVNDNALTSNVATNLAPGPYTVKAVTNLNCEYEIPAEVFVYDDAGFTATATATASTLCYEQVGNGTITAGATNNTNPNPSYEYSLDGTTYQTSPIFTDLLPDVYTVYVKDLVTGCVRYTDILVDSEPYEYDAHFITNDNHHCDLDKYNGTIEVVVDDIYSSNVNRVFRYSLYDLEGTPQSSMQEGNKFTNLYGDFYEVTVVDLTTGCPWDDLVEVGNSLYEFTIATSTVDNTNCDQNNPNGSITITVSGNQNPEANYTYQITSGQQTRTATTTATTYTFTNVLHGQYHVVVEDIVSGCPQEADLNVVSSNVNTPEVSITATGTNDYDGTDGAYHYCLNADGYLTGSATSVYPNDAFTYTWEVTPVVSNSNVTVETSVAGERIYKVTAKSVYTGCEAFAQAKVKVDPLPENDFTTDYSDGEPVISPVSNCANEAITIYSDASSAAGIASYAWSGAKTSSSNHVTFEANEITGGTMISEYLTITDNYGCMKRDTIKINSLPISQVTVNKAVCDEFELEQIGRNKVYYHYFKYPAHPELEEGFDGNTYFIHKTFKDTLEAANGCDSIVTYNITLKPMPQLYVNDEREDGEDVYCVGINDVITDLSFTHEYAQDGGFGWVIVPSTVTSALVTDPHGYTIGGQAFNINAPLTYAMNGKQIYAYSYNSCDTLVSDLIRLRVGDTVRLKPNAPHMSNVSVCLGEAANVTTISPADIDWNYPYDIMGVPAYIQYKYYDVNNGNRERLSNWTNGTVLPVGLYRVYLPAQNTCSNLFLDSCLVTVKDTVKLTVEPLTQTIVLGDAITDVVSSSNYTITYPTTLPAGLTRSGNTISGRPTAAGTHTFTISADGTNVCYPKEKTVTIIVRDTVKMTPPTVEREVCLGTAIENIVITLENGVLSNDYTLPAGLNLSQSSVGGPTTITISGTPTEVNTTGHTFTLTGKSIYTNNPIPASKTTTVTIIVNDKPSFDNIVETSIQACKDQLFTPITVNNLETNGEDLIADESGWFLGDDEWDWTTPATSEMNGQKLVYKATNNCGTTADTVTLVVLDIPEPEIISDTVICPDGIATLRVVNTQTGYTYQWYKDGVEISGATDAVYQFNANTVTPENDYHFTVVVTDENKCQSTTNINTTIDRRTFTLDDQLTVRVSDKPGFIFKHYSNTPIHQFNSSVDSAHTHFTWELNDQCDMYSGNRVFVTFDIYHNGRLIPNDSLPFYIAPEFSDVNDNMSSFSTSDWIQWNDAWDNVRSSTSYYKFSQAGPYYEANHYPASSFDYTGTLKFDYVFLHFLNHRPVTKTINRFLVPGEYTFHYKLYTMNTQYNDYPGAQYRNENGVLRYIGGQNSTTHITDVTLLNEDKLVINVSSNMAGETEDITETTGIEDVVVAEETAASMVVYPNPATTQINARINGVNGETSIRIVNIAGQVVTKDNVVIDVPEYIYRREISNLTPGVYFMYVEGKNATLNKKFVITK
ncbi:MAG: T9SS type A sorting domain-containing protein [Bacteroidales bacterium]|nr:T9SS type A sorting domain-containing protein [Bacteroidales bacterium]